MAQRSPIRSAYLGELLGEDYDANPPPSLGATLATIPNEQLPSLTRMEARETPIEDDTYRGLRSTMYGLERGNLLHEAVQARVAGDENQAVDLERRAAAAQQDAQLFRSRVASHSEAQNAGDVVDFLQSGAGQVAATWAKPIAGTLAGSIAGAALGGPLGAYLGGAAGGAYPAYQMEAGEQAASQYDDPYIRENVSPEEQLKEIRRKGITNAALELVVPTMFGGRVVGRAARKIAGESLRKSPLRRTKAVAREITAEATTELAQTLTGQAGLNRLNPNRDRSHDYIEQIDSIILGALGGSSISLGTTVPGYIAERTSARLGQTADRGARDLGRAAGELELAVIRDRAQRGEDVALDIPLRPSMQIPDLDPGVIGDPDDAANQRVESKKFEDIALRYQQAVTAFGAESPEARAIVAEGDSFLRRRGVTEEDVVQGDTNILDQEAMVEGRPDTLRLSETRREPTDPDINMLPDQPVPIFPSTGTAGVAKFRRRHVLRGGERRQLVQWKNQGFISEAGMDAAQSKPLGQWLEERNAAPEEVQAEADTMLRDINHRLRGNNSAENQAKLEAQKEAIEGARNSRNYGDLYNQLNEYSVIEFPPSEVEGRFTPQDADLQRRSFELVTGKTVAEKKAARDKLEAEEVIRVKLRVGGHKDGRKIVKKDVIEHARNFFREELRSYPEGQARDEAALLMGVFSDPRVTAILHNGKEITQENANLENPAHRAALKLARPERGYKFGKKPQDPTTSRAFEDTADTDRIQEMGEQDFDDPQMRRNIELEKLTAQRRRAEERLAEAQPRSPEAREAQRQVTRLNTKITRYWDESTGESLRPPTAPTPVAGVTPEPADTTPLQAASRVAAPRRPQAPPPIGSRTPRTQSPLTIPPGGRDLTPRKPQPVPIQGEQAAPTPGDVIVGDIWAQDGVKIVSTNLQGIHGRGLALQAKQKGYIQQRQNVDFDSSPQDAPVITIAVKGADPATAKIPGRAFSEQTTGKNLELMQNELNKLVEHARANPDTNFYMPFIGLGFGEGNQAEIMPILQQVAQEPNISLVSRDQATAKKYADTFRPGVRRDATTRDVPRGTQQQEAWQEGLPAHTIDRNLQNPDGTKKLAATNRKTGEIRVNPVETVEEFFDYFEGREAGPTSQQKLKVLGALVPQGWPRYKIRRLITTPDLANRFLVLHEQDHKDNNDLDVYFDQGGNYLTDDKITMEARASKAALDQIAADGREAQQLIGENQTLKPSRQIKDEDVANQIIYGRWAKNLREKGFQIVEDENGEYYVVDKDGKRVEAEIDDLRNSLSDIPRDLRYETREEAMADPENQERVDEVTKWMIRAFGPEIIRPENMGWMLAREAPGGLPMAGYYDVINDFIGLAVDSIDPLSIAFHEGMHKFVKTLGDSGNQAVYDRLVKAATAPHVMRQMERMLADYPAAIESMRADPEEAVAYAFQFHAASRLPAGPEFHLANKKLFMRVIDSIKKMLKIMTHARASEEIFDALFEGRVQRDGIEPLRKYQERSFKEYSKDVMDGIKNSVPRALSSPIIQLHKQRNADGEPIRAFQKLADAWHSQPLKGGPSGLVYRQYQGDGQYRNRWHKILADNNATKEDMQQALLNMQSMKPPSNQLENDLQHFFKQMYAYQFERGENPVKVLRVVDEETGQKEWVKPKKVDNYWPRIWSTENILANEIEFREVMTEEGNMTDEQVTNFIEMLQATDGLEAGSELQQYRAEFSPYNQAINARVFDFIDEGNAHKFAKFQEQDMAKVMDRYIRQAVHRREHSRTFGHDGSGITALLEEAKAEGATQEQIAYAEKVVQGLEGRLGTDKVSDLQREAMVTAMSITNYAVLAMATLSSMVDPLGVMVRTGSLKSATDTFKSGFKQILADARKTKTSDQELTEYLGIIEEDMVQDMLNNMERGIYMNEKLRKMNKFFFKSIGLEQWTRGTRIGAMRASLEYLKKNADNTEALSELGLEPGMIQEVDDRIKIKPEEFKTGEEITPADIETARKVQNAVFRMVDESILRPSAATRPLWASDMRFRLLGHLKSYIFTYHNQILRQIGTRAGNAENRAQAALAFMPLLSYIPVMIAADIARDLIQGDDEDRDLAEIGYRALQRSAILGMGTFLMDIDDELDYGGLPTNTMLGPVIDNTLNLGRTATNPDASFLNAGAKLLPYNALWRKWGDEE